MQDFVSEEYPDCIRDILGDIYGFTAIRKLQESWQYVQQTNPDMVSMDFNIARGWASLMMDEFEQQLSHPNLTKIHIFNQLNLPLLSDAEVILRHGESETFAVHIKGEQLTPDNSKYWQIISYKHYEIIRMLMVETIWRNIC